MSKNEEITGFLRQRMVAEMKRFHEFADNMNGRAYYGGSIFVQFKDGTKLVSIYPKVSGSISDAQVQAEPEKYGGAQVATEDMLTPDLLSWTLGATVGIKYSKQFALNKQAQKVKYVATDIVAEEPETPSGGGAGNGGNQGGNNNPPSGELEG